MDDDFFEGPILLHHLLSIKVVLHDDEAKLEAGQGETVTSWPESVKFTIHPIGSMGLVYLPTFG